MGEAFMPRRGGIPHQLWRRPIGGIDVGKIVKMNVNGIPTEFIIVNQGSPDGYSYGNGTWLLMKDALNFNMDTVNYKKFGVESNNRSGDYLCYWYHFTKNTYDDFSKWNYDISNVNTVANTFYSLMDDSIKAHVLTSSIPVTVKDADAGYVTSSWFSAKVFALSHMEVGFGEITDANGNVLKEGGVLQYFKNASANDRIAYGNGVLYEWWLRTPHPEYSRPEAYAVSANGTLVTSLNGYLEKACRLALVLSPDTKVDSNNNVIGI